MNFSWILLAVVSLAFAHAVVTSPIDSLTQASDELLVIRNKRCDINGKNCGLISNQANGGEGDNGGLGGNGGHVKNTATPTAEAKPVDPPLTRTKRCGEAGNPCDLTYNQGNGGDGNNSGLGGNGGNVSNTGFPLEIRTARATPVDSPLTRTKRCDIYGRNCGLISNQANGGDGNTGGLGGNGGSVQNTGRTEAPPTAEAKPVDPPLTRRKRCDNVGIPCGLISNQANGGKGDHHGQGGNGGHVENTATPTAEAKPVDSPLTRTKRCDIYGRNCVLTSNQANGGNGNEGGLGGNGGHVENRAKRTARATPVDSPLTRTKRCGEAGNPCDLLLNQANGGAGNNSGTGGNGGSVENQGVAA